MLNRKMLDKVELALYDACPDDAIGRCLRALLNRLARANCRVSQIESSAFQKKMAIVIKDIEASDKQTPNEKRIVNLWRNCQ